MRLNPSCELRHTRGKDVIVASGNTGSRVLVVNSSFSTLWKKAEGIDFRTQDLAAWIQEEYGLDEAIAAKEAASTVGLWEAEGLILP